MQRHFDKSNTLAYINVSWNANIPCISRVPASDLFFVDEYKPGRKGRRKASLQRRLQPEPKKGEAPYLTK